MLPTPNIQFSFKSPAMALAIQISLTGSHGGGEKEQRFSETDI